MITSKEIRNRFLDFFVRNGHLKIGDVSLIPQNDPTLLVINSGMAPLKALFTGEEEPKNRRLCNVQRCIRTNDIESVGDPHHLTFFEMMGNWSIGDYFKHEAINLAWQLISDIFAFDTSRIYVTVFGGDKRLPNIPADDESRGIWTNFLPEDRIFSLGASSNFWGPTNITGPCGPCTEVFIDRGQEQGCKKSSCGPDCNCGRFIEIWNAGVFMQYYLHEDKSFTSLPLKSVDAGAGIERFCMILQGVESIYDTDLFSPIIETLLTGQKGNKNQRSIRIISDHIRAATFMIGDSIQPGKSKREYVVRRLLRRAFLHMGLIGIPVPVLLDVSNTVISFFTEFYPTIAQNRKAICRTIDEESKSFDKVLRTGTRGFNKIVNAKGFGNLISGADAFKLHDTLGFPMELTQELARSRGIEVDVSAFESQLEEQRTRSRV